MTDQDKIPRFADGEPVHPFGKPKRPWRTIISIFCTWVLALAVLGGMIYLMLYLVGERRAHAQEAPTTVEGEPRDPSVTIFEKPGECFIDIDLRVVGKKRAACVDRLDTATRLARAEMRINERRKH